MGRIHILDSQVANQIAAGEVVEKPASVVKELIENALDANASHIQVYIFQGGLERIIVQDNGTGMNEEDAILCFSRYATSKIKDPAELFSLNSFGFRGEALPSIASVSQVNLITRPKDSEIATEIHMEAGHIKNIKTTHAPAGTRIQVDHLFFNTPARRKFLGSPKKETEAIEQIILHMALLWPQVEFTFWADQKCLFQTPLDPLERTLLCLSENAKGHLHAFDTQTDYIKVSGYLASPLYTRRDFKQVYLAINKRPIADKNLASCIKVAYRSLLEVGRFPVCALHVELDKTQVDVNAHPQKLQVRFTEPARLQSHLIKSIQNFLSTTPWLFQTPAPLVTPPSAPFLSQTTQNLVFSFPKEQLQSTPKILPAVEKLFYKDLKPIGQVNQTYLVLQAPHAMIILDQHAAHERVLFEYHQEKLSIKPPPKQTLLFPHLLSIQPVLMEAFLDKPDLFLAYGFEIEPYSDTQIILRAVPQNIPLAEASTLILDSLEQWADTKRMESLTDFQQALCASLACHSAIRAGQSLTLEEIQDLLLKLDEVDYNAHCPHGRPVAKEIPFSEMGKWFSRL